MYELLTLGIVAIAALFFQQWLHIKERESLLNRIMARDYEQFEYFQKQFKGEVEELKDLREDAREKKGVDTEIKEEMDLEYKKEKEFIDKTDEDWNEDDVDLPELRKRLDRK